MPVAREARVMQICGYIFEKKYKGAIRAPKLPNNYTADEHDFAFLLRANCTTLLNDCKLFRITTLEFPFLVQWKPFANKRAERSI